MFILYVFTARLKKKENCSKCYSVPGGIWTTNLSVNSRTRWPIAPQRRACKLLFCLLMFILYAFTARLNKKENCSKCYSVPGWIWTTNLSVNSRTRWPIAPQRLACKLLFCLLMFTIYARTAWFYQQNNCLTKLFRPWVDLNHQPFG